MKMGIQLKRFVAFIMSFTIVFITDLYVPNVTVDASTNISHYDWKQYSYPWGEYTFGSSNYTMASQGCAVTSVAILVAHSGVKNESNFDPGNFVKWLNNNNGFAGNSIYWGAVTRMISSFQFVSSKNVSGNNSQKLKQLKSWYDQGYYMVVSVTSKVTGKADGHWVAIRSVTDSHATIMDPGGNYTDLFSYSGINCVRLYSAPTPANKIESQEIFKNDDELGIPYPRPSGNPYLKTGSTGSYVSWLQTALNNLMNAGLSVDGQFGTGTKNAVIKFQKQYGLEADGVAGPSTINKLVECLKNKLMPIPAKPVAVVDNVSPGTATFSWNAVEGATSYKVTFRKSGDEYAVEAENYTGTSWTKTGLQPNTKYWFRVYAVNSSGSSPHSESISATTEAALDVGSDFKAMILNVNSKYLLTDEDYNAFFTKPTDTTNQFWYFSRNSNGSYTIETPSRKFALDVSNADTWNGTNVQLYKKNGTLAQQWFLCQAKNGIYFKSALGNYALDMSGTSLEANAHLWQFNGTAAQIFDFYRIDLDGNSPVDLGDNFYAKIENTATGKMLANSGNNVAGANAADAKNQLWHFIRKSNGSYEIISYSDDKSIDVSNYGTANGTNIGTSAQADNIAQRFFLYKIDGDIYIKTACSNNVFNMDLNTLNVAAWNYVNGVNPERFQIHKIESSVSKIVIATPAEKTEYKVGESLDTTGLTLKVTYNTGDTKTVSSGFTAKYDFSEAGDKTVIITYDGKSTTYNVTVNYSAFIITFDAGDGVCEVANKKVKYESAYGVLPTAEKAGYTFDGWVMADGTVIDSTSIVMITENTTVYATYSNASYIITFDAVYGTCDVENKKVKYGSTYGVLPYAEREGYIFHGWCLQDGTEISSTDIVTLTADTTVYALWEEEIIAGDVNADGTFTVADAVMLQKWLLNAGEINNWYAGDLCEDEVLNVFDLCIMKQMLLSQN